MFLPVTGIEFKAAPRWRYFEGAVCTGWNRDWLESLWADEE